MHAAFGRPPSCACNALSAPPPSTICRPSRRRRPSLRFVRSIDWALASSMVSKEAAAATHRRDVPDSVTITRERHVFEGRSLTTISSIRRHSVLLVSSSCQIAASHSFQPLDQFAPERPPERRRTMPAMPTTIWAGSGICFTFGGHRHSDRPTCETTPRKETVMQ